MVVDAVGGREGGGGRFTCGLSPRADNPLVVTDAGAPAWILPSRDGSVLLTTAGNGGVELDAAGPDGLAGLVAEGSTIRWLHDGEPRSADLG